MANKAFDFEKIGVNLSLSLILMNEDKSEMSSIKLGRITESTLHESESYILIPFFRPISRI